MLVSEPRLTWLEDPEVFAVNRKEAHTGKDASVSGIPDRYAAADWCDACALRGNKYYRRKYF